MQLRRSFRDLEHFWHQSGLSAGTKLKSMVLNLQPTAKKTHPQETLWAWADFKCDLPVLSCSCDFDRFCLVRCKFSRVSERYHGYHASSFARCRTVRNCAESSASYHSIGNISRHQVAGIAGPGAHRRTVGQWDQHGDARSPPVGTLALAGHPLVVVHLEGQDLRVDDRHHRHHRSLI